MARIALVHDERSLQGPFRMIFEAEGFEVDTFHDPLEALPRLVARPPDVLVLNGQMPGMHGIAFFKRFRLESQAPVIITSVSADEIEEALEAEGYRADAYVPPVPISQLLALVRTMLQFRVPQRIPS